MVASCCRGSSESCSASGPPGPRCRHFGQGGDIRMKPRRVGGIEIEIDLGLTGDQAHWHQSGSQPVADPCGDRWLRSARFAGELQRVVLELDPYRDVRPASLRIVVDSYRSHVSDRNAAESDRCPHREAAHGSVKDDLSGRIMPKRIDGSEGDDGEHRKRDAAEYKKTNGSKPGACHTTSRTRAVTVSPRLMNAWTLGSSQRSRSQAGEPRAIAVCVSPSRKMPSSAVAKRFARS